MPSATSAPVASSFAEPFPEVSSVPPVDDFPSVDLNSFDWNQFFDLHPGDAPGSLFAFDDLHPADFNPNSVPSLITDASSSSNSGFLGSGDFLEQTIDPRSL